jgi:hypothetical protein
MADTRNFVTLVKQMRAKWGDKYGISLTLAPDYWYLRWFDAKAMEARYVLSSCMPATCLKTILC